jgi:hypothetical protein
MDCKEFPNIGKRDDWVGNYGGDIAHDTNKYLEISHLQRLEDTKRGNFCDTPYLY